MANLTPEREARYRKYGDVMFGELLEEIDRLRAQVDELKAAMMCEVCDEWDADDGPLPAYVICHKCWQKKTDKWREERDRLRAELAASKETLKKCVTDQCDTEATIFVTCARAGIVRAESPDHNEPLEDVVERMAAQLEAFKAQFKGIGVTPYLDRMKQIADDRDRLRAELAACRSAAIEECAKIADEFTREMPTGSGTAERFSRMTGKGIAMRIRALTSAPPPEAAT